MRPIMTLAELAGVAARKGYVQWWPSGVVDRVFADLRPAYVGVLYVEGVEPKARERALRPAEVYYCREVSPRKAKAFRAWITQVRTSKPAKQGCCGHIK